MIVISLSELNEEKIQRINSLNKIVELRLDLLLEEQFKIRGKDPFGWDQNIHDYLCTVIKKIKVPLIATLRKKSAGGVFDGSEKERISILKKMLNLNFSYVDIEYDASKSFFRWVKKYCPHVKIICSYHNMENTPEDLNAIFLLMKEVDPYIYKIATWAISSIDSLRMLLFVREKAKEGYKISGICMGEKGRITRILSPVFNGYFSFAKLDENTAGGQFNVDIMEKRYGYSFLNEESSIFALIGKDVSKSYSHKIHNKIFSLDHFKNVYVKIPLEKEELPVFFHLMQKMPFKGLSITAPYKTTCLELLDGLDRETKEIHAANTAINLKGKWIGYNTDGGGAVDLLEKRGLIKDKRIVVLGAGGSARAICYEAKKRGAKVTVVNRTKSRAMLLAKEMKIKGAGFDDLQDICETGYDIIINATSSLDPLLEKFFLPGKISLDMNANPQWTPFLLKAKERGCLLFFGIEVFIFQAKKQFDLWFC